ncbi:MAG: AAA family ATPase [Chloroflexi bacterium]|nr:AAA family ATPase [Chloroflexota bacterium]
MLTEILLRNFKAFGDDEQRISLSRLNVFIGENGTGKSSVLQALALLAQSAGQPSLQSGKFQFSDYFDLVHTRQHGRNMALGFSGVTLKLDKAQLGVEFTYHVKFSEPGRVVEQDGQVQTRRWPSLPHDLVLGGTYKYGDSLAEPQAVKGAYASITLQADSNICRPIIASGGNAGSGAEGRQEFEVLQRELNSVLSCYSNAVKTMYVVKALRGFDALSYNLGDAPSDEPADGQAVATTFAYRREVEGKVATWLEQVTGVRVSVHLVPNKQASLWSATGYNIYYEGFGTNQLVWPLLQVAIAPEDSLIGIEEPEIHLHPKAQLKLCNVLAEVAKKENKQLVLTTHSDHMLTGFLNLVAEGLVGPQELCVYFFEKKDGTASATRLKLDEKGRLEGGLRGFMEVELEKLERRSKALASKPSRP